MKYDELVFNFRAQDLLDSWLVRLMLAGLVLVQVNLGSFVLCQLVLGLDEIS